MTRLSRRLLQKISDRRTEVFESFEAASAETDGYEDAELIDTVARKTETMAYRARTILKDRLMIQDLLVLHRVARDGPLKVLDVGGACGDTFFTIEALAPGTVSSWCVVETPGMVQRARSSFESGRLRFSADLDGVLAERPSLVFCKGVLHYTPDPTGMLQMLVSSGGAHVYVSRTHASFGRETDPPVYIRQTTSLKDHGPGRLGGVSDRTITVAATILPWASYLKAAGIAEVIWQFDEGRPWTLHGTGVRDMGVLVRVP